MLSVGIPKEIKPYEKRVGLTPSAVRQLTQKKIVVYVERLAGAASGFSDEDFQSAGAEILPHAKALYEAADLIQKVKEPLETEFGFLRKDQILFGYLHLASPENCALVETLVRSQVTAIAYETVEVGGRLPLLAPMSEIAGVLAAAYAAALMQSDLMTKTLLPSAEIYALLEKVAAQYPEFKTISPAGKAVIFGGGVAGFKGMETILKLKGEVAILEKNLARQEFLKRFTPEVYSPGDSLKSIFQKADILIGCVHTRGARATQVLDSKMLKTISAKKRKVIVDVAIDQGGNFPESGPTSYGDPVYFDSHRNLRFGVPNIPSLAGRGASEALSEAAVPYTLELAQGLEWAFTKLPELQAGVNVQKGVILLEAIKHAHRRL